MHLHIAPLPWPTECNPGVRATLALLEQLSKDRVSTAMGMRHNTIQGTDPPLIRNLVQPFPIRDGEPTLSIH